MESMETRDDKNKSLLIDVHKSYRELSFGKGWFSQATS